MYTNVKEQKMKVRTAEQLKKATTPEMVEAALNVFAAMALEEMVRPVVTKIQKDALKAGQWEIAPEWLSGRFQCENPGVILDPEKAYLMTDQNHLIYCAELDQKYKKAGYSVKPGYCPLLIAQGAVRDAEHKLIDSLIPITGLTLHQLLCSGMDTYTRYIELNLQYLAQYIKSKTESHSEPQHKTITFN